VDLYLEEISKGTTRTLTGDRAAKLKAMDESGILGTHVPKDEGKRVRSFDRLLKAPDVNRYIVETWGIAVEDDNPVQRYMRKIDEHAMQREDPRLSLDASKFALSKMLAPPTQRIQSASVVTRPAEFDAEPTMAARTILPEGQHVSKPPAPASFDDVEDEEQD
jgi:hypothetical protein